MKTQTWGRFALPAVGGATMVAMILACGSSSSGDNDCGAGSFCDDGASSGASGTIGGGSSGNSIGGGSSGASSGGTTSGGNEACATSSAQASLASANLIVMYDKSGSMGDPDDDNGGDQLYPVKWVPVANAMKQFFSDPGGTGLSASLQFFPDANRQAQGGLLDVEMECSSAYGTPLVPMTPLPDAQFGTRIDGITPFGGTPTKPAVDGAISYAQTIHQQKPNDKTVIILVTDGLPGYYQCDGNGNCNPVEGCDNNNIPDITDAVESARTGQQILTYVIGIEQNASLANLNDIAEAGGTNDAFIVSVDDPATTQQQLSAALAAIRGATISCEFPIPAPPDGKQLDPAKVNVSLTQNGQASDLVQSADCSNPNGWRYDDPAAPTKISLCPDSCNAAKANGAVEITFGCVTRTVN